MKANLTVYYKKKENSRFTSVELAIEIIASMSIVTLDKKMFTRQVISRPSQEIIEDLRPKQ